MVEEEEEVDWVEEYREVEHQEAECLVVAERKMEAAVPRQHSVGGSLAEALMYIQEVVVQLPWEAAVQKDILEVGGLQILVAAPASSVARYLLVVEKSLVAPKSSCRFFH
jgi:hypothetical protein